MNQVMTREEAAAILDQAIVHAAAEAIGALTVEGINAGLERFGVAYRVQADDARLTGAVRELAVSHNQEHKRDLAGLPDDLGVFAAATRMNTRALDMTAHRIVADALEEHVRAAERQLIEAVATLREASRIGVKHLGEVAFADWIPSGQCAELFGVAP